MEDTKVMLCRLCLNFITSEDSEILDTVERNILLQIIPELNLDISDDPKICQSCNKAMLASYEFRNRYNEKLLSTVIKIEENLEIGDLKVEENDKYCAFCMNSIEDEVIIEFNQRKKYFDEILERCIPQWSTAKRKESVPCRNCLKCLKNQFAFVSTCKNTEEQVTKYSLTHSTNSKEKINLYEVLQYILASDTKSLVTHSKCVDKKENDVCNLTLKTEVVDIKSEEWEDKLSEVVSSKQFKQAEASVQGDIHTTLLDKPKIQVPQKVVHYMLVDGNMHLQPSTKPENISIPKERKRSSTVQDAATVSKQQKTNVRQDLISGGVPEKRSVGVQVNISDLIERCSVGIQVSPGEVNTRTLGIDAKPDMCDKEVSCRRRAPKPAVRVECILGKILKKAKRTSK